MDNSSNNNIMFKLNLEQRKSLSYVVKLTLKYKRYFVLMVICNLFSALLEGGTIGSLVVAINVLVDPNWVSNLPEIFGVNSYFSSVVTKYGRGGMFLILVVAAICLQILKAILIFLAKAYSIVLTTVVTKELQEIITRKVFSLSYREICKHSPGSLNALFSVANSLCRCILMQGMNNLVFFIFVMVIYLSSLFWLSVSMTIVAIVVGVILSLCLSTVVRKLDQIGRRATNAQLKSGRINIDYLNVPRLVKIFNAGKFAVTKMNSARVSLLEHEQKSRIINASIAPTIETIAVTGIGMVLIIWFFTVGDVSLVIIPKFAVFLYVLNRLLPQVKTINQSRMQVAGQMGAADVLGKFLVLENVQNISKSGERFKALKTEIRFDAVSFSYDEQNEVLKDITFTIGQGKSIGLVGSSGGGKSTLADLLLGLHKPTRGSIYIDGKDLNKIEPTSWLDCIGVVDQETMLINGSIKENIAFGRSPVIEEDLLEASEKSFASEFICNLDQGFDTLIGNRGYRLSGGQRQRLALARALYKKPQILVLDEATSALDAESEEYVKKVLKNLRNKQTILVIAHRLSTITSTDQIMVVEDGCIVETGKFEELINVGGRFSELWHLQNKL